ncbi:MAG TPA: PaaI family thioesterase [Methylomirabilota bacterium]|nr:PaaI family thioesterase [Methylomirabilota bacterium]
MPSDLVTALQERARRNLFWRHLGAELEDAGEGWVRLRVTVRDELRNSASRPVHGGVLASLVDMAVGSALGTMHERSEGGVGQTTLDLNVSFLAGVEGGEVFAEGRIVKKGKSIAFGEARITDSTGKLVAIGRATYMVLTPKEGT